MTAPYRVQGAVRKLIVIDVSLTEEDFAALQNVAQREMRTTEAQAAWMIVTHMKGTPGLGQPGRRKSDQDVQALLEELPPDAFETKAIDR